MAFNIMDFAMNMLSNKEGLIDKIKTMVEKHLAKFADKMQPNECLLCVPSGDKTQLLIFRGTFTINPDKTFTVVRTGIFEIKDIIAKIDPSKLTEEQQEEIKKDLQ